MTALDSMIRKGRPAAEAEGRGRVKEGEKERVGERKERERSESVKEAEATAWCGQGASGAVQCLITTHDTHHPLLELNAKLYDNTMN